MGPGGCWYPPGSCELSVSLGLIGENNDPIPGSLCLYEFEHLHLHPVSKEILSVPHHHRRDHDPVLIDEVKLREGVDKIATANHYGIPITLLLQPGYFLGKIAMKQS